MLSVANLGGRLVWGVISDKIGRKRTYNIICLSGIPAFLSLPGFIKLAIMYPSMAVFPLGGFMCSTFYIVSIMGGVYATLPAYEADIFGAKYVGANHGKMLLASSSAGIVFD